MQGCLNCRLRATGNNKKNSNRCSYYNFKSTVVSVSLITYVLMFSLAGPSLAIPVYTSNWDPCQGHCTVPQISAPPASEPPRCGQRSSNAAYPFSVLQTTIRLPLTCTSFIWFTFNSSTDATAISGLVSFIYSSFHLPAFAYLISTPI